MFMVDKEKKKHIKWYKGKQHPFPYQLMIFIAQS